MDFQRFPDSSGFRFSPRNEWLGWFREAPGDCAFVGIYGDQAMGPAILEGPWVHVCGGSVTPGR